MFRFSEIFKDSVTDGVRMINTDHSYIHSGIAYKAHIELATFAEGEYLFHTPEAKYLHLKNIKVSCIGGSVRVALKRGTTENPLVVDSAGSATITELLPPSNLNDNSEQVTGVVITKTPTYVTAQDGEDWVLIKVNGTATNQSISSDSYSTSDNEEYVLKPDTDYVLALEQVGADVPTNFTIMLFWYEEGQGQ